jgi:oligopeptide transport system substrate-binding protein
MDPGSLDPATATDEEAFAVLGNVLEGLVRLQPQGEPLPGVAVSWTVEKGVRYTFHLRPDARWSDGQPVTARDFQYAWLRALDPHTGADYAYQFYAIQGAEAFSTLSTADPDFEGKYKLLRASVAVDAPDDFTLQVTLERPAAHWLALTASPSYLPVREDVVARYGRQFGHGLSNLVYNGPFVVTWWEPDQKLVLRRNDQYWDAQHVRLEQADLVILPDSEIAVRRFDAGELDRAPLPVTLLARYPKDRTRTVTRVAEPATWYLAVNLRHEELRRLDLRRAMSLSLDRREFTETVLAGSAMPAEGFVPPSIGAGGSRTFREVSGSLLAADPNRPEAETLWMAYLKERRLQDLHLELALPNSPTARRTAGQIKDRLEKALPGLQIQLAPLEQRELLQRLRTGQFDLVFTGAGADYDDPLTFLELFLPDSFLNDTGWVNAEYDALVRAAEGAPSGEARTRAMAAAEALLLQELPVIPLYHPVDYRLARPWLKGVQDFPLGAVLDLKGAYVEGRES